MASYRTTSIDELIDRRRREDEPDGGRYVDLRMDFEFNGEMMLSVGGVWDRRLGDYSSEADRAVVVHPHAGQTAAVAWFADWLLAHAERRIAPPTAIELTEMEDEEIDTLPAHAYSALFAGGRRGGKTWIACLLAVAYAIAFPGAIVWIVSPNDQKHDEVRRYVGAGTARAWLESATSEGWELVNGSRVMLKSGYNAEGLKEGEANFVVMNEGQMMPIRVYTVARGGIVDKSGLVLVCANPPVEESDHQWVADFAADAKAGRRASVYLEFNALENPHIDRRGLLAMAHELDERTYEIEVLGHFLSAKNAVAYNWNRLENERTIEHALAMGFIDQTEEFLERVGEGSGILQVAGLDVQRFPYIGGPVYRFFAPADQAPSPSNIIAWIVSEVVLEGGDEEMYCERLGELDFDPATTLIICDASGQYQHSKRRKADDPPPEWKGRGSFSIIRGAGYRRIVPPSKLQKSNPHIVDRTRSFTSMIANRFGRRRLFADPERAKQTCKAIREWKTVHGVVSRTQEVAHLGDGASYVTVRLFPRMLRSGNTGQVDPIAAKVDKVAAVPVAPDQSVVPPSRGPLRPTRNGGRGRGMW